MNIMYLTGCLDIGGTEMLTLNFAKAMQNMGHSVVWATVSDGEFRETVDEAGIRLEPCNLRNRNPISILLAMIKIRNLVKKHHIEIIHAIDAYSAFVASLAFRNPGKKCPRLLWFNVGISVKSYLRMNKFCGRRLDRIIATSQYIRNRMIEVGFDPAKVMVYIPTRYLEKPNVESAVIRKSLGLSENDVILGSVGRLVKMKGNETLIAALPKIVSAHKDVKLVIVGSGADEDSLRALTHSLHMEQYVIFTGVRFDVNNLYNCFDIVVFPTYAEALGNISIEAMYYQRPIIASNTGGIPDIVINNYNGLLVSPAVPDQWAESVIKLIENEALRQELVRNGNHFYAENLAPEKVFNRLDRIYREVV